MQVGPNGEVSITLNGTRDFTYTGTMDLTGEVEIDTVNGSLSGSFSPTFGGSWNYGLLGGTFYSGPGRCRVERSLRRPSHSGLAPSPRGYVSFSYPANPAQHRTPAFVSDLTEVNPWVLFTHRTPPSRRQQP